jgi:hypothetical protein
MRSATVLLSHVRRSVRRFAHRDRHSRRHFPDARRKMRRSARSTVASLVTRRSGAPPVRTTRPRTRPAAPPPTVCGFLAAVIH